MHLCAQLFISLDLILTSIQSEELLYLYPDYQNHLGFGPMSEPFTKELLTERSAANNPVYGVIT